MARRRRTRARRSYTRTVSRGTRRVRSGFGKVFKGGTMSKVVAGVGAATIGGLVVNAVAPQFSGVAKPISAYLAGGPTGAIASIALDAFTGQQSILGGLFGGGASQKDVGGL